MYCCTLLHFAWVIDNVKCIVVTRICVSVCLSGHVPTLLHGPGCDWGGGRECPLVVHYWADLQSVHGLHCYGNITRTWNVSEYMLVLALCLVLFHFCYWCQQITAVSQLYTILGNVRSVSWPLALFLSVTLLLRPRQPLRSVVMTVYWPDCKPEGPLFSAEFVCLCVCLWPALLPFTVDRFWWNLVTRTLLRSSLAATIMVQIGHRGTMWHLFENFKKFWKITQFEFQNSGPSFFCACVCCVL